jgi:hypothetical protein
MEENIINFNVKGPIDRVGNSTIESKGNIFAEIIKKDEEKKEEEDEKAKLFRSPPFSRF